MDMFAIEIFLGECVSVYTQSKVKRWGQFKGVKNRSCDLDLYFVTSGAGLSLYLRSKSCKLCSSSPSTSHMTLKTANTSLASTA